MARLVAAFLLATLVVVPGAVAEPRDHGNSPAIGWFNPLQGLMDWFLDWMPSFRSGPRRSKAFIEPSGVGAPVGASFDPNRLRAAPRKSGAYIDPSGIRAVLAPPENPGLRNGAAMRRIE